MDPRFMKIRRIKIDSYYTQRQYCMVIWYRMDTQLDTHVDIEQFNNVGYYNSIHYVFRQIKSDAKERNR